MTLLQVSRPNWTIRSLVGLPKREIRTILSSLTPTEKAVLFYDWKRWARPEQLEPFGDSWIVWLVLAGRGWGKTRTGAEWVRNLVETQRVRRVGLIAPTASDARDVMIEGESGILSVSPPWFVPRYIPSQTKLVWPNGAIGLIFSADRPDRLRGPQFEAIWGDELAAWRYTATYDNAMLTLRLGQRPRALFTTTPRPTKLIKDLVAKDTTVRTGGSTYDNRANLANEFYRFVVDKYAGTQLGRQEIFAEILSQTEGALWTIEMIESSRVEEVPKLLERVVVAIDPSTTSSESADEAGIVVAAKAGDHAYVLDDLTLRSSPLVWASQAIKGFHRWGADRIIGEANNGGEMVELTLRAVDSSISYKSVWASRGKRTRAEPIVALYERKLVHHVGVFAKMEDEMCTWVPGEASPNRMDAVVWALTELMLTESSERKVARSRQG